MSLLRICISLTTFVFASSIFSTLKFPLNFKLIKMRNKGIAEAELDLCK